MNRVKNENHLVVVLGMHRSGTSAFTHALEALGFDLGVDLCPSNEWNRKGQFEHQEINRLNDQLLSSIGLSWDSISDIEIDLRKPEVEQFRVRARHLFASKFSAGRPWALKDPRICRLLPFWESVFSQAGLRTQYLLVIRSPLDVAESLNRRDNFSIVKGCWLWARYMISMLEWLARPRSKTDCLVVDFEGLIKNPEQLLRSLELRFGSVLDGQTLKASVANYCSKFIDSKLDEGLLVTDNDFELRGVPGQVARFYRELRAISTSERPPLNKEWSSLLKRFLTISSEDYRSLVTCIETELVKSRENQTQLAGEMGHARNTIDDLALEIDKARRSHAARDAVEGELRQNLAQREEEIDRARTTINNLASEIEAARQAHTARDAVEGELRQNLAQREEEIDRARTTINNFASEIEAARQAHTARDAVEGELRQNLAQREEEIDRARTTINNLASEIEAARRSHAARDAVEGELRQNLAQREEEIDRARTTINNLASEIEAARQAHTARDAVEGELRQNLAQREEEIDRARTTINNFASEIEAARQAHTARDAVEGELRQNLAQREEEIDRARTTINNLASEIEAARQAHVARDAIAAERAQFLEKTQTELVRLRGDLNVRASQIAAALDAVKQYEATLPIKLLTRTGIVSRLRLFGPED